MRSFFKGVMGFGLVAIPVSLFKALDPESVALHWVHRECGSRIRYRKFCPVCDSEVEQADLDKAAVTDDGRLVVVDPEPTRPDERPGIHILSFHPLGDVDPVYIGDAYWVKPEAGALTPYRLLWQAMHDAERIAAASFRMRGQDRLALVRPYESGALVLHRMHYPESLRREGESFGTGSAQVTPKERDLAAALIAQLAAAFDPDLYPNEPKAALMRQIAQRAAEAPAAPVEAAPAVADLVEQLRASLAVTAGTGP